MSVKTTSLGESSPDKLPERIYVEKFQAPSLCFHVSRKGKALSKLIEQEQKRLVEDLVKRLNKHIAPTEFLEAEDAPLPQGNYWLVRGNFDEVNGGNRLLRAGIGFGLGKTTMQTTVQVLSLSQETPELLLTVTTTGGSGALPGAIAALVPLAPLTLPTTLVNIGGSAGGGLGSGISSDRWRTSREIVAAIAEYCEHQHLPIKSTKLHPKRLGKLFIVPH